jgi:hypothetical protein
VIVVGASLRVGGKAEAVTRTGCSPYFRSQDRSFAPLPAFAAWNRLVITKGICAMKTLLPPWHLLSPACIGWLMCVALSGCGSRLLKEPRPADTVELGWTANAPEGLKVVLDQVIVPNGGGSWVRNAGWDEYVVTLKSTSLQPLSIEGFELYGSKLLDPVQSTTSRQQLEKQTSAIQRTLKGAGIIVGTTIVTTGAAAAAAGTGGWIISAAAGAAIVTFPIAVIGSTTYVIVRHHRNKKDRELIDSELMGRGFGVAEQIAPGTTIRKSAFFPVTPAPNRLIVHHTAAGESNELSLDLPALADLHLVQVKPAGPLNANH